MTPLERARAEVRDLHEMNQRLAAEVERLRAGVEDRARRREKLARSYRGSVAEVRKDGLDPGTMLKTAGLHAEYAADLRSLLTPTPEAPDER